MTRLLPCCALLLLTGLARAAEAPPAPPIDRTDPAKVADAYLAALGTGDVDSVLALIKDDPPLAAMLRMMRRSVAMAGGDEMGFWLYEAMLVPFGRGIATSLARGDGTPGDGTLVYSLRPKLDREPQLVLVRAADGNWQVDLRASLIATVGEGHSMLLREAEMMANLPAEQQAAVASMEGAQAPWEAQQKLQQLASALVAYAEEHDKKLPEADRWCDEIQPYVEGDKPFGSPTFPDETYSFAFNAELSGATLPDDWQQRQQTLLVADTGGDERNQVFFPDELAGLPPRYDNVNLLCTASGMCFQIAAGTTFAELMRDHERTEATEQRLSELVQAVLKFAEENEGKLPDAATWCDDLAGLMPRLAPDGGDPLVTPGVDVAAGQATFAINAELAGRNLHELHNRRRLVIFFETEPVARNTAVAADFRGPARHRTMWSTGALRGYHRAYLNGTVSLDYPNLQAVAAPAG